MDTVTLSRDGYERLLTSQRFSDSLVMAMWYDGFEDNVNAMIEYIANNKEEDGYVPYPDHINETRLSACVTSDDTIANRSPAVLWECLVLTFGEYGTSPRYGWITSPDMAVEFLKSLRRDTYGFPHHHEGDDGPPIWEVSDEEYAQFAAEWESRQERCPQ